MTKELLEITGTVLHETDSAFRFQPDDGAPVWFPKSQVEWDAGERTMILPVWLATEKKLV